jgi:RNA polymerase primary sigma factor
MIRATKTTRYASQYAAETHSEGTRPRGLPRDEVQRLAARIADGDREARNLLVKANLGLVWQVARRYLGRGLAIDDLVGEGNLGLIRAAEEFDPSIGTSFSTYATYWIKQSILSGVMNTAATIRVPAHVFRLLTRWMRTEQSLRLASGRAPSCDEIASALGLNEQQKFLVMKARNARDSRLEGVLPGGSRPWPSAVMMDSDEAPEALLEADEERNGLQQRLGRLECRERTVLILRYGLDGQRPMKLHEVGQRLGLSKEWVRKIADLAIRKLVDNSDAGHRRNVGSGPRSRSKPRPKANNRRSGALRSPARPSLDFHDAGPA